MNLNLSDDCATFDGLASGTYFSRQAEATFAAGVAVTGALKRVVTRDVLQSSGLLVAVVVVWHLTAAALGATVPKATDMFQESDGTQWTVERVEVQTLATRYRLTCRREV